MIVTGFQGINKYDDITTLGRGGSDTSAGGAGGPASRGSAPDLYRCGRHLHGRSPACQGGGSSARSPLTRCWSWPALARRCYNRSVEMAKKYNVNLEVISSFSGNPGTKVKEVVKTVEKFHISGAARIKILRVWPWSVWKDEPGIAFQDGFSLLGKHKINVDIILQSIGRNESKDISFTVVKSDLEDAKRILDENKDWIGFDHVDVSDQIAKVSIVGAGMMNTPGMAARMFEALFNAGININMISTSEIKVSVLVAADDANRAVQVIHDQFFDEFNS